MKTYATYFQNDEKQPLCYGEINLINPPRQRLRGEEKRAESKPFPFSADFAERTLS